MRTLEDTRVIFLNGPPRSGKDTGAKHLARAFGSVRIGFADHLKVATHAAYGLFAFNGAPCPALAFEAVKDTPLPEFMGLSPRQAYIAHSERYIKPLHDDAFFGHMLVRRMARFGGRTLVAAPDSGFAPEAAPVLDAIGGPDRALLVRVRAEGRGKTYDGDSRSFIELPGVRTVDLRNDAEGDAGPFLEALSAAVADWLGDEAP